MIKTVNHTEQDIQQLRSEGSESLFVNIGFFVLNFAGILLLPALGIQFAAITICTAFVLSLLYIYLT